jgi:hypothetical protein
LIAKAALISTFLSYKKPAPNSGQMLEILAKYRFPQPFYS